MQTKLFQSLLVHLFLLALTSSTRSPLHITGWHCHCALLWAQPSDSGFWEFEGK